MWSITRLLVFIWVVLPFSAAHLDFSACVFPFIYKNKTYSTCTKDGSKLGWLWCATSSTYDKDHNWKRCSEREHGGNSDGKPCVFPFVYKKRKFYTCTDENAKPRMFWCATTSNFDKGRKWSYCADTILVEKPSYDVDQERTQCDPSDPRCLIAFKRPEGADQKGLRNIQKKGHSKDENHERDPERTVEQPASDF